MNLSLVEEKTPFLPTSTIIECLEQFLPDMEVLNKMVRYVLCTSFYLRPDVCPPLIPSHFLLGFFRVILGWLANNFQGLIWIVPFLALYITFLVSCSFHCCSHDINLLPCCLCQEYSHCFNTEASRFSKLSKFVLFGVGMWRVYDHLLAMEVL